MPIPLLAYFLVEALAFFLVAKAIGVGWALLAIFVLMIAGGAAASLSLRGALLDAADGRSSVGKLAGDSALLIGGWTLSVIPGFVTSLIGLPLVFGPTRNLIRKAMTRRARAAVENLGVRVYEATPMGQFQTSYGSFTQPGGPQQSEAQQSEAQQRPVIDAEELEKWYRMDGPEDQNGTGGAR
ncbi:FxsA family protein [Corynebacterium fournieri]|uniref:FxsA family protein n=1 Tax=Corynebacterium fournieri TaxID=1852390 RepID=UPI000A2F7624|nr:FxsA family protein [Corynebacterium fournieri]WJY97560.1 phage T7 F exclusion suppressor FxsA [Corynebacterium fournieri]